MGIKIVRQRGGHVHLEHIIDKTRKITVPMHNKDVAKKTFLSIAKQGKMGVKELLKVLKK